MAKEGVGVTMTGRWVGWMGWRVRVGSPGARVSIKTGSVTVGCWVGTIITCPSVIATRIAPRIMMLDAMADRKPIEISFRLFMIGLKTPHSMD